MNLRELTQTEIDDLLQHASLQALRPVARARLLAHAQACDVPAGGICHDASSMANAFYCLLHGDWRTDTSTELPAEWLDTAHLPISHRTVQTEQGATLIRVEYAHMQTLFDAHPQARQILSMPQQSHREVTDEAEISAPEQANMRTLLGWFFAITLPIATWFAANALHLGAGSCYFLSILCCVFVMWISNLMPAYVPPFFSVLALIVFDVTTPETALSGFSTGGFFMLLSVFAIGGLMVMSDLTYRLSLWILRLTPNNWLGFNMSLFCYGFLLTPVIPSQLGRTIILSPFLNHLLDATSGSRLPRLSSAFFVSAMAGISLQASIFLTGKPANLLVFDLFDSQTKFAFEWSMWAYTAAVTACLLLLFQFGCLLWLMREPGKVSLSKKLIDNQLRVLGPLTKLEWGALLASASILLGITTTTMHGVEIPWLTLAVLVMLLLFGTLTRNDLNSRIDWSILIFIGAIVAWVPVMRQLELDQRIASSMAGLGELMRTHLFIFTALLCLLTVALRLILPELVAAILLVTFFFPVAASAGVSQWLVGFVILTMSESYLFPYQSPAHVLLQRQIPHLPHPLLTQRIASFNAVACLARMAALLASFPFWTYLNLI